MKTTVELPEDLFLQAKRCALDQGTTLKALIETGLRNTLMKSQPLGGKPFRISVITHMAQREASQGDINAFIDLMRSEQLDQLPQ